jgi:hypothetical protein
VYSVNNTQRGPFLNNNTKNTLEELRMQEAKVGVGDYQRNTGSDGRGISRSTVQVEEIKGAASSARI